MALMMTASAQAAGDEKNGEQVFNQCKPCHSLEAGKNGVGPTLHGLFAAKPVPFRLQLLGCDEELRSVWNEDTLKQYLPIPTSLSRARR